MPAVLANGLRLLRQDGLGRAIKHTAYWLSEKYHARRLGISTEAYVYLTSLGIDNPLYLEHSAAPFRVIHRAMREIDFGDGGNVFLDLGSGLGRAVVVAATYPFEKVIGVEIAPQLLAGAEDNLRKSRSRLRCPDVELVCADATEYVPPPEVTFIFAANPFRGDALRAVIGNIRKSLARTPRRLTIVWINDDEFEQFTQEEEWLLKRETARLYPDMSFGRYEAVLAALDDPPSTSVCFPEGDRDDEADGKSL